jgi:phosphoenolpyruvate synthase/pyruvate phosphate dikinase
MYEDLEGFELSYSVQIDSTRVLELLVDEIETGDSVWQTTNACGQILDRSDRYEDQALCLRDGLNKALPQ